MASEKELENTGNKSEKTNNKAILLLSIINLIITFALCILFFISFKKDQKKQSIDQISEQSSSEELVEKNNSEINKDEKKENGKEEPIKNNKNYEKMISLDPFTVNLSTTGSAVPKFVRLNLSLGVSSLEIEEEVNTKIPQIRNIIIDLLNSKRESDLSSVDGRESLKEEIQNTINSVMSLGKIKGVFFTNFALSG